MNISRELITRKQLSAKPVGCAAVKEDKREVSIERMEELCAEYGIDPAKILLAALASPNFNEKEKANLAVKMMPYVRPQLKAVEHSGEIKSGLAELLEEFNKQARNIRPVEG